MQKLTQLFVNLKQGYLAINNKTKGYAYVCWLGVCDRANTGGFATETGVVDKVHEIINVLVYGSGLVAVIILVYGAFLFITAGGDDQKIETGHKTITAAIVGLIIVFIANVIIRFVIDKVL